MANTPNCTTNIESNFRFLLHKNPQRISSWVQAHTNVSISQTPHLLNKCLKVHPKILILIRSNHKTIASEVADVPTQLHKKPRRFSTKMVNDLIPAVDYSARATTQKWETMYPILSRLKFQNGKSQFVSNIPAVTQTRRKQHNCNDSYLVESWHDFNQHPSPFCRTGLGTSISINPVFHKRNSTAGCCNFELLYTECSEVTNCITSLSCSIFGRGLSRVDRCDDIVINEHRKV